MADSGLIYPLQSHLPRLHIGLCAQPFHPSSMPAHRFRSSSSCLHARCGCNNVDAVEDGGLFQVGGLLWCVLIPVGGETGGVGKKRVDDGDGVSSNGVS